MLGLTTAVLTLKDDDYTMKIKTKALIIRDEYLIKSDTNGVLSLIVSENEKVQNSQKIAVVYNSYINNSINKEIYDLKEDIKEIEKNNNSFQKGVLSAKKEQLKILEEKVKNNSTDYYSDTSGVVSYKYDNNENKYSSENLSGLIKEDIEGSSNNYISTSGDNTKIKQGETIARIINNNEVYLAFVSKDNKLFKKDDSVKIKIKKELINGEIYWVEGKTGNYQHYINKYSHVANMLNLDKSHSFLVLTDVINPNTTYILSKTFDMTIIPVEEFEEEIKYVFHENLIP